MNWQWDETSHRDVPEVSCLWHLILALAKAQRQGEHEIRRSGVPPARPADKGSSVTQEVTARASRAIGPPAAIFAATLTPDQCDRRRGGTAISWTRPDRASRRCARVRAAATTAENHPRCCPGARGTDTTCPGHAVGPTLPRRPNLTPSQPMHERKELVLCPRLAILPVKTTPAS